jgi:soluble lytic murein transglycosylase-like protein
MSILSELKQQKHSLDDLAMLPQSLIMQMAQKKQIMPEMVAPILSRKAEMMEAVANTKALQSAPQAMAPTTVLESLMAKNVQPPQGMAPQGQPMPQQQPPAMAGLGQMQPQPQPQPQFAGGGVVAFAEGDYVDGEGQDPEEDEFNRHQAYLNRIMETYGGDKFASPTMASSRPMPPELVALASPTSKRYDMQRSSVMEKSPEQSRPEVREVTKERTQEVSPQAPPKTQERVEVKATPTKTPKGIPNPLSHPYADMVAQDAKKYGVDPKISLRLLNNETGGIKNPETAVSSAGAVGIAQFMPKTAGQYKIDPTDPKQSSDAMNKHVKHLMREYGDPKLVAIAYNWGEGNTNKWLQRGADPRMLPKETRNYLEKFMVTALAKGGEVKSYAEGGSIVPDSYESKMKRAFGYEPFQGPAVQRYMSGGNVKHFDGLDGSYVSDPMGMGGSEIMDVEKKPQGLSSAEKLFLRQTGNPEWKIQDADKKALAEDIKNKAAKPAAPAKSARPVNPKPLIAPTQKQIDDSKTSVERQAELGPAPSDNMTKVKPENINNALRALSEPEKEAEAPVDQMGNVTGISPEYDNLIKKFGEREEANTKQRKEDKAYAIIMSGLATMGGESPNALTNIAKGQMAGLGMLQENRKQNAAEDARLMQMQGTVLRYKDAALLAKEAQTQTLELRRDRLRLEQSIAKDNKTAKDLEHQRNLTADVEKKRAGVQRSLDYHERMHFDNVKLQYGKLMDQIKDAVLQKDKDVLTAKANRMLTEAQAKFDNDPVTKKFRKELFPEIPEDAYSNQEPSGSGNAIPFDQLGKRK